MFDFSFFELLLVSLVALLVVGPDRLPTLVRTIGFWVGRGRAMVTSLRSEFEREVNAAGIKETERRLREEVPNLERDSTRTGADAASTSEEASRNESSAEAKQGSQAPADSEGSPNRGLSDRP